MAYSLRTNFKVSKAQIRQDSSPNGTPSSKAFLADKGIGLNDDEYFDPEATNITYKELEKLSQQANPKRKLQEVDDDLAKPQKRTRGEIDASQRQRGRAAEAETLRNSSAPERIDQSFGSDFIPRLVEEIGRIRQTVAENEQSVTSGCKAFLKQFNDDELGAFQLAGHFSTEIGLLLETGIVPNLSPDDHDSKHDTFTHVKLPIFSRPAGHPRHPSGFNRSTIGLYRRGVYLIEAYELCLRCQESGRRRHYINVWYYVGSARSSRGGMILRSVQHSNTKYRNENRQLLYDILNRQNVRYRTYVLADWDPSRENPNIEPTFDDILLVEAICQNMLATGDKRRMSDLFVKMHPVIESAGPKRRPYGGLNQKSALERDGPAGNNSFNQSFG
jgi:hypothetical protein